MHFSFCNALRCNPCFCHGCQQHWHSQHCLLHANNRKTDYSRKTARPATATAQSRSNSTVESSPAGEATHFSATTMPGAPQNGQQSLPCLGHTSREVQLCWAETRCGSAEGLIKQTCSITEFGQTGRICKNLALSIHLWLSLMRKYVQ